jgi:cytochrome c-type biogenesis protein CcmE
VRKRYLVGGVFLLLAVGYLLFLGFGDSISYYVTVSEFSTRSEEFYDTNVRIAGKIDNPIDWNAEELELKFTITEGGENLSVIYHGAQPAGFKADSNILVEGKYHADGIFRASQLIMKCPSKYEPEE